MWVKRRDRKTRACRRAQASALQAVALDEVPDTATVRELRPAIEDTADKETIEILRRFLRSG